MRCEPAHQIAFGGEHIDESVARSRDVVLLVLILLGIGDEEEALEGLNVEGREARRDTRIEEGPRYRRWTEVAVEDVDRASVEVSRVEEVARPDARDGQPLVDRAA